MGSQDVGAGTDPTVATGISPRIGPSPPSRTAPVTDDEMLLHLTVNERVSFGMVMQAIMDYWHESKFEEQLSDLCSNRIWIDRLVAQPHVQVHDRFLQKVQDHSKEPRVR